MIGAPLEQNKTANRFPGLLTNRNLSPGNLMPDGAAVPIRQTGFERESRDSRLERLPVDRNEAAIATKRRRRLAQAHRQLNQAGVVVDPIVNQGNILALEERAQTDLYSPLLRVGVDHGHGFGVKGQTQVETI